MHAVSLFEAKTHLSRIIESLVTHEEDQVIISRYGKPVARLTVLPDIDTSNRIGIARGKFVIPDHIDSTNETIASMFGTATEVPE